MRVTVGTGVAVRVVVGTGVAVRVAVGIGVVVRVAVGTGVLVRVDVGTGVAVRVRVVVTVVVGTGVVVTAAVAVGTIVAVVVASGVATSVAVGIGGAVALATSVAVALGVGVGCGGAEQYAGRSGRPAWPNKSSMRGASVAASSTLRHVSRRSMHPSQSSKPAIVGTPTSPHPSAIAAPPPPAASINVANVTAGSRHTPPTRADPKSRSARRPAHAAPVARMHALAASPPSSRQDVMLAAQVASVLLRDSKKRLPSRSAIVRQRSSGRPMRRASATLAPSPPWSSRQESPIGSSASARRISAVRGTSSAVFAASAQPSFRARHVPSVVASSTLMPWRAAHAGATPSNPSPSGDQSAWPMPSHARATAAAAFSSALLCIAAASRHSFAARSAHVASPGRDWRQRNAVALQRCNRSARWRPVDAAAATIAL